jgi:hypothetical protein
LQDKSNCYELSGKMSECFDANTGASRELRAWDTLDGCVFPSLPSTAGQYFYNLILTNATVLAKGVVTLPFPAPPAGLTAFKVLKGWRLPITTPTGATITVELTADVNLTAAGNVSVKATGRDIPVGSKLEWPFLVQGVTDCVYEPTTTLVAADGAGVGGFSPSAAAQSSANLNITAAYNSLYAGLQTINFCREAKPAQTFLAVMLMPSNANDYTREIITGTVTPTTGSLPTPSTAIINTTINCGFTKSPVRIYPQPI